MSDPSDPDVRGDSPTGRDDAGAGPARIELDPAQIAFLEQRLRFEQNLPGGVLAGSAAALAGAAGWASVTVATGYQIGFMAIAIGFAVGFAVRAVGRGTTVVFGVAGASLALAGCALGNLLAVAALVARNEGVAFLDLLARLTPELAFELMVAFASPMDVLFYGFALYEGYRLSFRQVDEEELRRMLSS